MKMRALDAAAPRAPEDFWVHERLIRENSVTSGQIVRHFDLHRDC